MNRLLFVTAAAAAVMMAAPASAQAMYGQVNIGLNLKGDVDVDATVTDGTDTVSGEEEFELDGGWLVSGAIGSVVSSGLRVEGEVVYLTDELGDASLEDPVTGDDLSLGEVEVTQLAALANVLWEPVSDHDWVPYLGVGVGFGKTSFEIDGEEDDDTGLVWQVRAGLTVPGGPDNVSWDIGYRYLRMADFETEGEIDVYDATLSAEPSVHSLTVGVRFGFGG